MCDMPKHRFSAGYRRKKRALIKAYKRSQKNHTEFSYTPPKPHIKLKYLWLAIILAAITVLTGSFFVWYHISGFTFKREQTNSTVYYDPAAEQKTVIEEYYCIPESTGYTLKSEQIATLGTMKKYTCGDAQVIFDQNLLSAKQQVNTEGYYIESVKINGYDGYFIQMDEDSFVSWIMDGYVFSLTSDSDKTETIKLAESVIVEE